jgi:hypothetical protein
MCWTTSSLTGMGRVVDVEKSSVVVEPKSVYALLDLSHLCHYTIKIFFHSASMTITR